MLTREQMQVELESLRKRETQLLTELNQIIGARQFCEFVMNDNQGQEESEQPALSLEQLQENLAGAGLQVGDIEPVRKDGNHASS